MFLHFSPSPEQELRCARNYVDNYYPGSTPPLSDGAPYRHDRIKIAYLSSDFRDHAVGYLTAGLFARHDRSKFEVYGISLQPDKSEIRERISAGFEHFIEVVGRSDYDAAMLLRELEIDIVVHLNGHTDVGRMQIMAHRPGPLQVNFLGYPGTSGASYFDYIIADWHVVPAGEERWYSESVVRLPHTYQVNDRDRRIGSYIPPTCR